MPVIWNFRGWLKERGITRASQVGKLIYERTGYKLSTQAVCDLFNDRPKMLRLKTIEAICDTFYCRLTDFCEVTPVAATRSTTREAQLCDGVHTSQSRMVEMRRSSGSKRHKNEYGQQEGSGIDFAAFFPDARKFSPNQPIED